MAPWCLARETPRVSGASEQPSNARRAAEHIHFSGCTYQTATNYDEGAVIDDGSCNFEIANPCPADLNGDGSVSTADLLEFLTAFGQEC